MGCEDAGRLHTTSGIGAINWSAQRTGSQQNKFSQGTASELGRHADALPPAEEAVILYRELATANPAHRSDLARALTNLGARYGELGLAADAFTATESRDQSLHHERDDNDAGQGFPADSASVCLDHEAAH